MQRKKKCFQKVGTRRTTFQKRKKRNPSKLQPETTDHDGCFFRCILFRRLGVGKYRLICLEKRHRRLDDRLHSRTARLAFTDLAASCLRNSFVHHCLRKPHLWEADGQESASQRRCLYSSKKKMKRLLL